MLRTGFLFITFSIVIAVLIVLSSIYFERTMHNIVYGILLAIWFIPFFKLTSSDGVASEWRCIKRRISGRV